MEENNALPELLEKINSLNKCDQDLLIELIEKFLQRSPDEWILGNAEERYTTYESYTKEIAELISKIEVYAHDLPPYVGALAEYLWHMMAVAAIEEDEEDRNYIYRAIRKYVIHIKNELRKILVDLYLEVISGYQKTLKCFNHQGIKFENIPIMSKVKNSISEIKSLTRRAKRIQESHFTIIKDGRMKNLAINYLQVNEIKELTDALNIAEKSLLLCENNYGAIVGNGYHAPVYKRILVAIPDVVSFGVAIYGLWRLITIF